MHVKEVAERLNTTPRSIRFYEEKGLIFPEKDVENDYRSFTEHDLVRLSTILALREVGMSVKEIKRILENPDMSIRQYLNVQRSALFEKWIEMKDMIDTIDKMIEQTTNNEDSADDFYRLAQHLKQMKSLRKGWEDKWNFDKQAADYDQNIKMHGYRFNVHQDYQKALAAVVDMIQLTPGQVCLDIGIGTGNLGSQLLPRQIKVIGVDQSDEMLKTCSEKHPDIETRKGHFLALPLTNNYVDGVISSYALHHIPDQEKVLALAEMDRVLKVKGQICIVDLMFLNRRHRKTVIEKFQQAGNTLAIDAIEDEFYADRSVLEDWFTDHDYDIKTHQFNDILSMIYAKKRV